MLKDRPNRIPRPRTIARHYFQGRYCDYPTDTILSAVNSHEFDYNPTAIPIRLGFKQIIGANFDAFVYISEHRTSDDIRSFLSDPNGYMADAGVPLCIPFDEISPHIFTAMVEDDMLEALKSPDDMAVCKLMYSKDPQSWRFRHPERFPEAYMNRDCYWKLAGIPYRIDDKTIISHGFPKDFAVDLLFICRHFSD